MTRDELRELIHDALDETLELGEGAEFSARRVGQCVQLTARRPTNGHCNRDTRAYYNVSLRVYEYDTHQIMRWEWLTLLAELKRNTEAS